MLAQESEGQSLSLFMTLQQSVSILFSLSTLWPFVRAGNCITVSADLNYHVQTKSLQLESCTELCSVETVLRLLQRMRRVRRHIDEYSTYNSSNGM